MQQLTAGHPFSLMMGLDCITHIRTFVKVPILKYVLFISGHKVKVYSRRQIAKIHLHFNTL